MIIHFFHYLVVVPASRRQVKAAFYPIISVVEVSYIHLVHCFLSGVDCI